MFMEALLTGRALETRDGCLFAGDALLVWASVRECPLNAWSLRAAAPSSVRAVATALRTGPLG
jgi:hypothetical protein